MGAICKPLQHEPLEDPVPAAPDRPQRAGLEVSIPSLPALWNNCVRSPSTSCSSRASSISVARQQHCESFSSLDGCIGEEPDRISSLDSTSAPSHGVILPPRNGHNVALVYKVRRSPKRRPSHTVMRASPNDTASLVEPRDSFLCPGKPPTQPRRVKRASTFEDLL
eukprot:GGOE01005285.1.p1 GENE.GGOE01005285.1~~GGOE01005285.1.p1  ORF type:complete len:176 (-),score=31.40 GGOE01005285.1:1102-1599(-)